MSFLRRLLSTRETKDTVQFEIFDAPAYQYTPLPSKTHIRLVTVAANKDRNAPILCSLRDHDLDSYDVPPYSAVSYTWGADRATHSIYIDHAGAREPQGSYCSHIMVQDNLFNLLCHLRDRKLDRVLWIDAIAINQASKEEKNTQVPLMGRVYSSAETVIAWLESTEYPPQRSGGASENLAVAGSSTLSTTVSTKMLPIDARAALQNAFRLLRFSFRPKDFTSAGAKPSDLTFFCNIPYWTRKWIIQEIMLASNVVLQAGYDTLPMTFMEESYADLQLSAARTIALERFKMRSGQIDLRDVQLHHLLYRFRFNECNEPADHVYALSNLVGFHRKHLKVDYNQTAAQRCLEVFQFLLEYEKLDATGTLYYLKLLASLLRATSLFQPSPVSGLLQDRKFINVTFDHIGMVRRSNRLQLSRLDQVQGLSILKMSSWLMIKFGDRWNVQSYEGADPVRPVDLTGVQIRGYFTVPGIRTQGLSNCDAVDGDWILKVRNITPDGDQSPSVPTVQNVFIVRARGLYDDTALLVGNATIFDDPKTPSLPAAKVLRQEHMTVSMGELLTLVYWAQQEV